MLKSISIKFSDTELGIQQVAISNKYHFFSQIDNNDTVTVAQLKPNYCLFSKLKDVIFSAASIHHHNV